MNITALILFVLSITLVTIMWTSFPVTALPPEKQLSKTTQSLRKTTKKIQPRKDDIDFHPPSPSLYDINIGSPTPAVIEFSNDPKPFNTDAD